MKTVKRTIFAAAVIVSGASACTGEVSVASPYCGESFCLKGISAAQVRSSSPVEDFNIYRVALEKNVYVIYEGNAPQASPPRVSTAVVPIPDAEATYHRDSAKAELRITRKRMDWPSHLVVTTDCEEGDCGLQQFGKRITKK